jgi:ubiquinone/menaquinone biosynthesis C-methylase UbiE
MPSSTPIQTPPAAPTEYILGTGDTESTRLGLQHRLWSASAHNLWERVAIRPGMSILDVGCGPGHGSIDLAQIVGPAGRIYAVDESPLFLKHLHDRLAGLHLKNIDRILGDAQQLPALLPSLASRIDIAYCRWVLCFVPDPEAVIRGVASLLKPGGRFAIQDYFNYESMTIAPRKEAFSRVIRAVGKSWRTRGGDPDIISRIPALFRKHGLELTHLAVNERIAQPHSSMWAWPDAFWASYLPRLVEMGEITREEQKAFEACWSEASDDPDSFMLLPPVFDVVGVKTA